MYEFHNNYMMEFFPGSRVVFTDTDSFCYIIPNVADVYEVMKGSKRFDFSNLPKNLPNYSTDYKKIPGKFKDECPDSMIEEVVGQLKRLMEKTKKLLMGSAQM